MRVALRHYTCRVCASPTKHTRPVISAVVADCTSVMVCTGCMICATPVPALPQSRNHSATGSHRVPNVGLRCEGSRFHRLCFPLFVVSYRMKLKHPPSSVLRVWCGLWFAMCCVSCITLLDPLSFRHMPATSVHADRCRLYVHILSTWCTTVHTCSNTQWPFLRLWCNFRCSSLWG